MLAKPTAKLADRMAPKLLRDNQELIIFFSIFSAVTQKNFLAATDELKKIQQKNRGPLPPDNAPGPVRVPSPPSPGPADFPAPSIPVPFAAPQSFEAESLG